MRGGMAPGFKVPNEFAGQDAEAPVTGPFRPQGERAELRKELRAGRGVG